MSTPVLGGNPLATDRRRPSALCANGATRPTTRQVSNVRLHNMKTIAISIDDDTLERVDRLTTKAPGAKNRSQVIRQAVREYVQRVEQTAEDEREAVIVRRHRSRLSREARALVRQQAKP